MCFHNWIKWQDILVFNYGYNSYVLQGRKCKNCNKTVFRFSKPTGLSTVDCGNLNEDKMKKAGLWISGNSEVVE